MSKPGKTTPARHEKRPSASPLTRRKRTVFIALMGLLPVLALALIEGVLRLCGFGGYSPTIREVGTVEGAHLITTDPRGAASYFRRSKSKPGSLNEFTFLAPKPANTVRVFLAGGSAIKGFPQPMAFAPSAFLEAMLSDVWPDRTVEVINLGTTAVASFPVLEMATEALEHEPDLVVVYTGHNEFFGAYGVASLHGAGTTPTAVRFQRWFRSLAVPQALERLAGPPPSPPDKTLMELVVRQGSIGPDDPLRDAAARNLYTHISAIIERCRARGVPVIVGTLASNERGIAPIGKPDVTHLSAAERQRLASLTAAGVEKIADQPSRAVETLRSALAIDPDNARAHFRLGQALYAREEYDQAAKHFSQAIDLDPMPWRAPSKSVEAVRRAAADHNAVLCNVQQRFRDASPGGITGWELFDDHVHPSLAGQCLLARAIVNMLISVEGPLAVPKPAYDALLPFKKYAERMGDNMYDRYGVAHTLRLIFNIPFMRESNPDGFERFHAFCTQTETLMSPAVRRVAREWVKPSTHKGARYPLSGLVGRTLIGEDRYREAEGLFRVAQNCVPNISSWNLEFVYFMLACREKLKGSLDEADRRIALDAIRRGRTLLRFNPYTTGKPERYVGRLHQLRDEFADAIPYLRAARRKLYGNDLLATDQALVASYLKTGDYAAARRIINQGIEASGEFAEIYRRLLAAVPEQ